MAAAMAAATVAMPAAAAEPLRDLCSDRPGLNTPACTVDPRHLQLEAGLGDWTLDKTADSRTDTVIVREFLARYGLGPNIELTAGWNAYGHARVRDRATGTVQNYSGTGDVTLGFKQNFAHPDGSGLSVAALTYVTLPTGRHEIGADDWSVGLLIPATYELNDTVKLLLTPQISVAVDEDGDGRHTAFGSGAGLQVKLSEQWGASAEAQIVRDRDPGGHETHALAGLFATYQPGKRTQLDAGVQAGLTHATPDVEISFGVTTKF